EGGGLAGADVDHAGPQRPEERVRIPQRGGTGADDLAKIVDGRGITPCATERPERHQFRRRRPEERLTIPARGQAPPGGLPATVDRDGLAVWAAERTKVSGG